MAPEESDYMNYVIPRSVTKLEEELAELERQLQPPSEEIEEEEVVEEEEVEKEEEEVEVEASEEPSTPEEKTFKQRYSDLRRHNQKVADDLKEAQAKIATLEKQKSSSGLPTAEEAESWAKENPKAAAIIRAIATNETATNTEELAAIKDQLKRSEQESRILKAFPNFEELTSEDTFHDWAEEQPESVQKLIFSASADDVIWSLKQYVKDVKTEKPNFKKEAAKAISSKTTSGSPRAEGERRFSESQVNKMSMPEYEANEAAIAKSIKDGTFVYDLSGGAR